MPIQHLADTALITAFARAVESQRPDALVKDPFAAAMAGDRGAVLGKESQGFRTIADSVACRTAVFDELLLSALRRINADMVLNLAAGLDARPFRLALPAALQWVDVDSDEILNYKSECLGSAEPNCQYEQIAADLSDVNDLQAVIEQVDRTSRAIVLSEGLLVYLSENQVAELARRLASATSMKCWITELAGPRALAMMASSWGEILQGAKFQFAPADPKAFFGRLGWTEVEFRSSQEEAQRLGRAPKGGFIAKAALLAAPVKVQEELRRLSGVAVLERAH
jgi:methyltransferase (TIGR00027 family)